MTFSPIGTAGVRIVPEFDGFDAAVVEASTVAAEAAAAAIKKTFAAAFKDTVPSAVTAGRDSASTFTASFSKALTTIEAQAKAVFASITAQAKTAASTIASAAVPRTTGVAPASTAAPAAVGGGIDVSGVTAALPTFEALAGAIETAATQLALFGTAAAASQSQLALFADATVATINTQVEVAAAVEHTISFLSAEDEAFASSARQGQLLADSLRNIEVEHASLAAAADTVAVAEANFAKQVLDTLPPVGALGVSLGALDQAFLALGEESQANVAALLAENSAFESVTAEASILNATLLALKANLAGLIAEEEGAGASLNGLKGSVSSLLKLGPAVADFFAVKQFADFEKAAQAATVVFGRSSDEIKKFATDLSDAFGLSDTAALRASTDIGNTLKNLGFSTKTAADATQVLINRAGDLGAAFGKTPQQVITAFSTALEGQTRGLKTLGIDISAVDVKNRALELGFSGSAASMSDAQKAATVYSLILEKTNQFQGQAAETADTLAGRLRTTKAEFGDLAKNIGASLAPALEFVIGLLDKLFGVFAEIAKNKVGGALLAAAAAAATSAIAFLALGGAVSKLGASFGAAAGEATLFGLALDTAVPIIGGLSLAVGAAVGLFALFGGKSDDTKDRIKAFGDQAVATSDQLKKALGGDTFDTLSSNLEQIQSKLDAAVGSASSGVTAEGAALPSGVSAITAEQLQNKARADSINLVTAATKAGAGADAIAAIKASGLSQVIQNELIQAVLNQNAATKARNEETAKYQKLLDGEATSLGFNTDAISDNITKINALANANKAAANAQNSLASAKRSQTAAEAAAAKLQALAATNGIEAKKLVEDQDKITDSKQRELEATQGIVDAQDRQKESLKALQEAQRTLDDLVANESTLRERELSDATDNLTSAQIAYERAVRARIKAENDLKASGGTLINLQGKTIAQIREILANARANAQAVSQQATSSGKTPQELKENAILAAIDERAALEKVQDAQKTLNDTQAGRVGVLKDIVTAQDAVTKAESSNEASIRAVSTAQTNATKATRERQQAEQQLRADQKGDPDFQTKLAAANQAVADARQHVADASKNVQDAAANAAEAEGKLANNADLVNAALLKRFQLNADLIAQLTDPVAKAAIAQQVISLIAATTGIVPGALPGTGTESGDLKPGQGTIDRKRADALNALLRQAGFPALFAEGGIVSKATLGIFGEAGREGLIPFTKPARAAELLAGDPAWAAIQAHIDRITLPSRSPLAATLNLASPSGRGGQPPSPGVDDLLDVLRRIEKKLDKNGITVERGAVTIEQRAGEDATLVARRAVQSLERRLGRAF